MLASKFQEIFNSPLNDSISKALYTFPKSPRFDKNEYGSYCAQAYYELPKVASKRGTSMGFGQKLIMGSQSSLTKSPGPERYEVKGEFDKFKNGRRGFVFGVSREQMKHQGILANMSGDIPGPGQYEQPSQLSQIKYTIRPRNETKSKKFITIPGPGAYEIQPAITDRGQYTNSKFKGSGACRISTAKRFNDDSSGEAPGPGKYDFNRTSLNKTGKYFINGFKSSSQNSFPHQKRITGVFGPTEKTPGPGSYRMPSDFGHYDLIPRLAQSP